MKPEELSTPSDAAEPVSTVEPVSPQPSSLLTLVVNLPERYRLVSIHLFHTGEWIVCVCIQQPGEMLGLHHAMGQHHDVNEAARLAMERCEMKMATPKVEWKRPIEHSSGRIIPGLDPSTLRL